MIVWSANIADDPAVDPDPAAGLDGAEITTDTDPAHQRGKIARRLAGERGGKVCDSSQPS